MFKINAISSFALDISASRASHEMQSQLADLVYSLLGNNYRVFLFSSDAGYDMRLENFQHPRLSIISHPMPPGEKLAREFPELSSEATLWMTEDEELQDWLNAHNLKLAHRTGGADFGARAIRIGSPSDLAVLFDPREKVLQEVGQATVERRQEKEAGALLVGIGGPPLSGFQQFAIDLRAHLQSMGCSLVDLVDVSPFMPVAGQALEAGGAAIWSESTAGTWLLEKVLGPLKAGDRVYVETQPEHAPEEFEPHLPLFLSEESVVLVMGERLFIPPVAEVLDMRVLLQVSARETTRRVYEIPEGEHFDEKFLLQYFAREGGVYRDYLDAFAVAEGATIRLSAEKEGRLSVTRLGAA